MKIFAGDLFSCCLSLALSAWSLSAAVEGRITKAELGTDKTEKYEPVNPATEFHPDTAQIVCVWTTQGVKAGTALRVVWIAEDVGKLAPPNYKIIELSMKTETGVHGSSYLTKPNKGFPAGKYRLEIYLEGELAKTVPFTIAAR
ncbi:MAG TPA: hypothetical protein VLY04_18175 [Bryobacteraceae bacterium]|nr:hypothetical protein [Bryobacteraceae bacterium]